ncbi:hypothetical protein JHN52_22080 [Streptomyces sp. MBT97]|uniref:hypothetical protein n=1 Tax=Streptomyces sp. MBT97 TaxID=2800411 RepID=UPI00190CC6D3|nr:hypothetical protein [Streptomyces sp. MBT97]MBK3635564.1 hypothetical protein [Streptomyces sp. MBT97]
MTIHESRIPDPDDAGQYGHLLELVRQAMSITVEEFLQGLADDGYPFTKHAENPDFCLQHGWHTGEHPCPACHRRFLAQLHDMIKNFEMR